MMKNSDIMSGIQMQPNYTRFLIVKRCVQFFLSREALYTSIKKYIEFSQRIQYQ